MGVRRIADPFYFYYGGTMSLKYMQLTFVIMSSHFFSIVTASFPNLASKALCKNAIPTLQIVQDAHELYELNQLLEEGREIRAYLNAPEQGEIEQHERHIVSNSRRPIPQYLIRDRPHLNLHRTLVGAARFVNNPDGRPNRLAPIAEWMSQNGVITPRLGHHLFTLVRQDDERIVLAREQSPLSGIRRG